MASITVTDKPSQTESTIDYETGIAENDTETATEADTIDIVTLIVTEYSSLEKANENDIETTVEVDTIGTASFEARPTENSTLENGTENGIDTTAEADTISTASIEIITDENYTTENTTIDAFKNTTENISESVTDMDGFSFTETEISSTENYTTDNAAENFTDVDTFSAITTTIPTENSTSGSATETIINPEIIPETVANITGNETTISLVPEASRLGGHFSGSTKIVPGDTNSTRGNQAYLIRLLKVTFNNFFLYM